MIIGIVNILRVTAMNFLDNNYSAVHYFFICRICGELTFEQELKIKKNKIKNIKYSIESYRTMERFKKKI